MQNFFLAPRRASLLRSLFAASCAAMMLFSTVPAFAQKGRAPVQTRPDSDLFSLQERASFLKESSGGFDKMSPKQRAEYTDLLNRIAALQPAAAPVTNVAGTIAGTLTATDPTFNRPLSFTQGGSCTLSGVGTAVRYKAIPYTLNCSSNVTISLVPADGASITPAGADTYLVLYGPGGFNPATPCANAIAANDDAVSTLSRITTTTPLAAGNYTIVVTSFDNVPAAPGALPWSFNLFVSDTCAAGPSNVDSQVSFTTTTVGLTGNGVAACGTLGYTNQYNLNVDLRNIGTNTFTNPFFQVIELQQTDGTPTANPFRLRTADDFNGATCSGGLVGTTQAIPGPITPAQVVPVNFQIAMPQLRRFRFLVSVFATVGSPNSRNGKTVKLGELAVTGLDRGGKPVVSATFTPEKGQPSLAVANIKATPAR
jgi:hypothetical protein